MRSGSVGLLAELADTESDAERDVGESGGESADDLDPTPDVDGRTPPLWRLTVRHAFCSSSANPRGPACGHVPTDIPQ
jgi:hypothetical protein